MADVAEMGRNALESAKKASPSTEDVLSDPKRVAVAGAALIALPYAVQGIARLVGGVSETAGEKVSELGERSKEAAGSLTKKATANVGERAKEKVGEVAGEQLKPGKLGGLLSGGLLGKSGDGDEKGSGKAAPGYGSGRRMPIQQSVDVAAPITETYNWWTRFEDWPEFMHRVDSADQVDDATVAFSTKVWGITKRFEADIVEQHPDERIEWNVTQGLSHTGVVTFHELAPKLTRIELTVDVEPDSLLEKAGRGMRFAKRAVRGDLHRFKAFAELNEDPASGWRGTIEDGEVKRRTERRQSRSGSSSNRSRNNGRSRGQNGSSPSSRGSRKRSARGSRG
jgi:uncharacterized membrane protein